MVVVLLYYLIHIVKLFRNRNLGNDHRAFYSVTFYNIVYYCKYTWNIVYIFVVVDLPTKKWVSNYLFIVSKCVDKYLHQTSIA